MNRFPVLITIIVLLSVIVAPALSQRATNGFSFPNFSSLQGLSTVNSVKQVNNFLRLCDPTKLQKGEVWYELPALVRGFETEFTFRITDNGDSTGEDGFAFVIQTASPPLLAEGPFLGGLGYGDTRSGESKGIKNSLAIEFDTFLNPELDDPNGNHISVHTRNDQPNSAHEMYSLADATSIPYMRNNGTSHSIRIVYTPNPINDTGVLLVYFQGISDYVIQTTIRLDQIINLYQNGSAWVGFTASTGNTGQNQDILSWTFNFLGHTDPSVSTASGPGLAAAEAGEPATFTIHAVDQFHNPMIFGGSNWTISLDSEPTLAFQVVDTNDGNYTVTFTPTKAVSGKLSIHGGGEGAPAIVGSPFALQVAPGAADPANCVAMETQGQTGLTGPAQAGELQSFTVQLRDRYGNDLVSDPKVPVTAKLENVDDGKESPVNFAYRSDGQYVGEYTVYTVGKYKLSVMVEGKYVTSANHTLSAFPGAINGTNTLSEGANVGGIAGVPATFKLQMVDSWGNNVTNITKDPEISVTLKYEDISVQGTATPIKDGLYEVTYLATIADKYVMTVEVNGNEITGSPFHPQVDPVNTVDPSTCVAYGGNINLTRAGFESFFFVQTKDRFGNIIPTEHANLQWTFQFIDSHGQTNNEVTENVQYYDPDNNTPGLYKVSYNVTKADNFKMNVLINGTAIEHSPFSLLVKPGPSYGPNCEANPQPKTLTKERQTFTITAKDRYNNLQNVGGDKFSVVLLDHSNAEATTAEITDKDNGSYEVTYVLKKSGQYALQIRLNSLDISGSPFMVKCKWAGLPTSIIVVIGCSAVAFVAIIAVIFWVYRAKCRKRRLYEPLPGTH